MLFDWHVLIMTIGTRSALLNDLCLEALQLLVVPSTQRLVYMNFDV